MVAIASRVLILDVCTFLWVLIVGKRRSKKKHSILGAGARLHAAKALDAVLAENTGIDQHINLSAGMITANFRTDGGTISSTVKGKRLDTGRTKLGAVIGAGTFVSVGAMLMPGVKIGEGTVIGPQAIVQQDVFDHTLYYVQQQIVKKPLDR